MAGSKSIGNVYAELSVKDKMTVGMKRAGKSVDAFASKINGMGLRLGSIIPAAAAGAGAAIATGMVIGTKKTLGMVDSVADLSQQTGIAVADMMKLQRGYEDGGRSASMTAKDIGKMQKSIADVASGRATFDPFSEIGLNAKELINLSPAQQFDRIGAAIMKMTNPAERNAKAMQVFGKAGMGLTSVFGTLDQSVASLGRMPELAEEFAGAMGHANDIIGRLPVKSDQFFVGFTSGIIGQILPELNKVDGFDFSTLGENLGNSISRGLEILKDGDPWQIFALKAKKAIKSIQLDQETTMGQVMNAWAAGMNAYNDPSSYTNGEGFGKFWENFDRYSQAGLSEGDGIAEIDQQISDILAAAEKRAAEKTSAAASITAPIPEPGPASQEFAAGLRTDELGIPILSNLLAALPYDMGIAVGERDRPAPAADWSSTQYEVNDMQRRGLGMGGEGVTNSANEANKKIASAVERIAKKVDKLEGKEQLEW